MLENLCLTVASKNQGQNMTIDIGMLVGMLLSKILMNLQHSHVSHPPEHVIKHGHNHRCVLRHVSLWPWTLEAPFATLLIGATYFHLCHLSKYLHFPLIYNLFIIQLRHKCKQGNTPHLDSNKMLKKKNSKESKSRFYVLIQNIQILKICHFLPS